MMSDSKLTDVHLIERLPEAKTTGVPILFIHGAFSGAWCWDEHFMPYFAERGHVARAVDLPGRRGRPDFPHLQDFSLSDYLEAVLIAIDQFDQPPVLVQWVGNWHGARVKSAMWRDLSSWPRCRRQGWQRRRWI
jgi:pimeloyl-ACP methyl ester carboxylesterase